MSALLGGAGRSGPQRIACHPPAAATLSSSTEDGAAKVRAILRVRPPLPQEPPSSSRHPPLLLDEPAAQASITNPRNPTERLSFSFDGCYGDDASQLCIFARDVVPVIDRVLAGYNATVFAYGNTGAGKTFTMEGSTSAPGMIPLTVQYVLEGLKRARKPGLTVNAEVSVSYLEIYREKVYDLLAPNPAGTDLPIREDAHRNIIVPDLTAVPIANLTEFDRVWMRGVGNRRTAATKLNAHSSRSHSCLTLQVPVTSEAGTRLFAKLHLIDLAGSEDNRRTANAGERLAESGAINRSLFVLGQVVDALNTKALRVPFRDSKLTRLLQDSLGGNAYALIIANVAPCESFLLDTCNTLNFAAKSRLIQNHIKSVSQLHQQQQQQQQQADRTLAELEERETESARGKRVKTSSPATMASSTERHALKKTKKTHLSEDKENNPFVGSTAAGPFQTMILERKIEEKLVQKLREMTRGTVLSPLMKGDASLLRSESFRKSPLRKAPPKPRKPRKPSEDLLDPHVAAIIPMVEPELLRIINYGTLKEIKELKEIGAKRAQAILEYRQQVEEMHTLAELVTAEVITNKILGKIVLANSLGHVDFVPAGATTAMQGPADREDGGHPEAFEYVANPLTTLTRHHNPVICSDDWE